MSEIEDIVIKCFAEGNGPSFNIPNDENFICGASDIFSPAENVTRLMAIAKKKEKINCPFLSTKKYIQIDPSYPNWIYLICEFDLIKDKCVYHNSSTQEDGSLKNPDECGNCKGYDIFCKKYLTQNKILNQLKK